MKITNWKKTVERYNVMKPHFKTLMGTNHQISDSLYLRHSKPSIISINHKRQRISSSCHQITNPNAILHSRYKTSNLMFKSLTTKFYINNKDYHLLNTNAFFGVGAPEAVLVVVVALIVFGPKGLAEVVKSFGKTLRSFQPTIKEIVEVSSDLKSTLEEEIGLDELKNDVRSIQNTMATTLRPSNNLTSLKRKSELLKEESETLKEEFDEKKPEETEMVKLTEEMAKEIDPNIEEKRKESEKLAWHNNNENIEEKIESTKTKKINEMKQTVDSLSLEELELEIKRRKESMKNALTDEA